MAQKSKLTPIASALGVSLAASVAAGVAHAEDNPFAVSEMSGGYMLAAAHGPEGKCGEGKCGEGKAEDKDKEGKCGEGKCGEDKAEGKDKEGKCGEGKCGGDK